jgi:hypothetical protein
MSCPHCGESARFVGYRPKTFVSLLGDIRIERAYYHCASCRQGSVPWDGQLRLSSLRLTPAAEEVVTLLAIKESFVQVTRRTLTKSAGLRLSESTVQRVTESAGDELGAALDAGRTFGPQDGSAKWKWNTDAEGKTCAYVSVDATGVLMQGPDAGKVDGRMVTVGMVFNPQPRQGDATSMPCEGVRYLAGFYALDELGPLLRRQGGQVGMNDADRWIALTDAGSGLERFIGVHFPRARCILDFQHPVGYLTPLAQALRSTDADRRALLSSWCHALKHEGGEQVRTILESIADDCIAAGAGEALSEARTYFRNHVGRMNYPEYLRKGWQIGTGAVESACKTVVNQRLSMGGMRWGEYGGDNLAHLRALNRSDPDQWDAFWAVYRLAV